MMVMESPLSGRSQAGWTARKSNWNCCGGAASLKRSYYTTQLLYEASEGFTSVRKWASDWTLRCFWIQTGSGASIARVEGRNSFVDCVCVCVSDRVKDEEGVWWWWWWCVKETVCLKLVNMGKDLTRSPLSVLPLDMMKTWEEWGQRSQCQCTNVLRVHLDRNALEVQIVF